MFNKKTIKDIDLTKKRVLLRADYNVPIKNGAVGSNEDYRMQESLPTIKHILAQQGCSLVIISHLGRPKTADDKQFSLAPVAKHLSELLGRPVKFAADCIGEEAKNAAQALQPGEVLMLENVRFHPEEEKNDANFARQIVGITAAQIFVQDGFGVVHRAHATTDAIAHLLPSAAGLLLEKEVKTITDMMSNPPKPLVAVIGGAKIGDKIEFINKLVEIADCVAIGGAMSNDFLVAQGIKVGKSLVENEVLDMARSILEKAESEEQKRPFSFIAPVDVVVSTDREGKSATRVVDIASHSLSDIQAYPKKPTPETYTIGEDEMILDVGPITAAYIAGAVEVARSVIWNGNLGVTETSGIGGASAPFSHGTKMVVSAMIGKHNQHLNKPFSLVGGGDTAAYVESEGLISDFNHVSTGGGAALELMSGKSLPGIEVLPDKEGSDAQA